MSGSNIEIFQHFQTYDFDHDAKFQAGLNAITSSSTHGGAEVEESGQDLLEQAKWFYYNKFIKPFSYSEFLKWKRTPLTFQQICELVAAGKPIPGIKKIEDKLNENPPSIAQLRPKPKPWEMSH